MEDNNTDTQKANNDDNKYRYGWFSFTPNWMQVRSKIIIVIIMLGLNIKFIFLRQNSQKIKPKQIFLPCMKKHAMKYT